MKTIPYYHIDAFSQKPYHGNPAGVCLPDTWLDDDLMVRIAAENRLSETAFVVTGERGYEIRWFTPVAEINLCGHATLAAGFVLFNYWGVSGERIDFLSPHSGRLSVSRQDDLYVLDFPSLPATPCMTEEMLIQGLGQQPQEVLQADDTLAVFGDEDEILDLKPNFDLLKQTASRGIIVTAPGKDCDFVSRFFCPKFGIDEDPVTGSAHCSLIPYWSRRLGIRQLHAKQLSARGGELFCRDKGQRVAIGGHAVCYLTGDIFL